ncbi:hypothetical protein IHE44_0008503 [Lamprotornis superbus]|uniref:Uncharacterized protein n=1 Tax=Lamprotornis superbus TaxID=245042 RepID=A0A835NPB8_9PASS|nr:hypothetical protein IHE44_0008503 [Lamprotornis superbus]
MGSVSTATSALWEAEKPFGWQEVVPDQRDCHLRMKEGDADVCQEVHYIKSTFECGNRFLAVPNIRTGVIFHIPISGELRIDAGIQPVPSAESEAANSCSSINADQTLWL